MLFASRRARAPSSISRCITSIAAVSAATVAGSGGPTGSFYYGVGFVAYISARDTAAGTFRDLASLYWNTSISGTFDTAQPVGSRVTATGGRLNRGNVIEGGSGEFPAMHGGAIANASHSCTDA